MAKDPNIYRVTYNNGEKKMMRRGTLGLVIGAHLRGPFWQKHPVTIERAPEPAWEDVTAEFLPS